jgi:hypothetical protein
MLSHRDSPKQLHCPGGVEGTECKGCAAMERAVEDGERNGKRSRKLPNTYRLKVELL